MALISTARFTAQTDRMGKIDDNLIAIAAGTQGANVTTGLGNAVSDIQGYDDDADLQVELLSAFQAAKLDFRAIASGGTAYKALRTALKAALSALSTHMSKNGATSIDKFCTDNAVQVYASFRDFCAANNVTIATVNTFKAASVDPMATFAVSGSGAGTYTHVANIDTANYGPAPLEAVVTGGTIGAASITATVVGTKFDGSPITKTATITNGATVGTAFAVGLSSDLFATITNVTIVGGTASDAFKIRSKVLRTPSL